MPWTCGACERTLADDVGSCATCGATKQAWTLHAEKTRQFVVQRAKLEALRGADPAPVAPGAPTPALEKATACPVIPRAALAALLARGERPGWASRLVARVWPRTAKDRTVTLVAEPADREREEHAVPREADAPLVDGAFDVVFVGVVGPGETPDLRAEGLVVVGLEGVPTIEVGAVRQRVELPVEAPAEAAAVEVLEVEDVGFPLGRAVLLPDGRTGQDEATGLVAIAAALQHARRRPDRLLLVAGHADPCGGAAVNLALSQARATNVHLFLAGDRDGWAAHAQAHHDAADVQRVLGWTARTFGWACDPGPVDGDLGKASKAARDAFRRRFNAERGAAAGLTLVEGAKQSEADWAAAFDLYDEALADKLRTDRARVAALRAGLRFASPPALGCGEAWATAKPGADRTVAAVDRRVDVLFFDLRSAPDLAAAPPGASIYGPGRYEQRWLDVDDAWREPELPPDQDGPMAEDCTLKALHPEPAGTT